MNAQRDRAHMIVIKHHRQMIVQTSHRMEIQLERTCRDEIESEPGRMFAVP